MVILAPFELGYWGLKAILPDPCTPDPGLPIHPQCPEEDQLRQVLTAGFPKLYNNADRTETQSF